MRERGGRSLPFIVANEGDACPIVRDRVGTLATIYADRTRLDGGYGKSLF